MNKKTINLLLISNGIYFVVLGILSWVYFIQPSDGLGLNLMMKHVATGAIIITVVVALLINITLILWDRFNR